MFEKLTDLLDRILERNVPGNDCIICRDGEVVYRRFKGFVDRDRTRPMTGKERYHIFSCSKIITCCAALQLFEKGLFALDDELCRFLPEFREMSVRTPEGGLRPARNRITMRELFAMTSGFSYDMNSMAFRRAYDDTCGACPTRKTISYLAQEPLLFEPGTDWSYSLGHDVLAAVVEELSGMPFNDYVTKNIFGVLGMPLSTYLLPAADFRTVTPLYREETQSPPLSPVNTLMCGHLYRPGACYASGGAGCVSTVEEFNKVLLALCAGEKILKRETVDLMRTDQLDDRLQARFGQESYGYGLGVRCPPRGNPCRTDFGWGGAGGAYFAIDPERRLTVLYMQHVINSSAAGLRGEILKTVHACLD